MYEIYSYKERRISPSILLYSIQSSRADSMLICRSTVLLHSREIPYRRYCTSQHFWYRLSVLLNRAKDDTRSNESCNKNIPRLPEMFPMSCERPLQFGCNACSFLLNVCLDGGSIANADSIKAASRPMWTVPVDPSNAMKKNGNNNP